MHITKIKRPNDLLHNTVFSKEKKRKEREDGTGQDPSVPVITHKRQLL